MKTKDLSNLAGNMESIAKAIDQAADHIEKLSDENRELKKRLVAAQSETLSYIEKESQPQKTTNKSSLESLVAVMSEEWQISSEIVWAMVLDSAQKFRKPIEPPHSIFKVYEDIGHDFKN